MTQHRALVACAVLLGCGPGDPAPPATAAHQAEVSSDRQRVIAFWAEYRKGTDARIAGRLDEAAEQYTLALAHDPDHEDALYYLGAMSLELGRFDDAETAWRHLVDVNPASARGHTQLGRLYMCADRGAVDARAAKTEFERAAAINLEQTGPSIHLGQLALAMFDTASARRHFAHVLISNPGSIPANYFLGYLDWRGGATARAEAAFTVATTSARPSEALGLSEGDTKTGTTPLLARKHVCADFETQYANLHQTDTTSLSSAMVSRYTDTERWLARRGR